MKKMKLLFILFSIGFIFCDCRGKQKTDLDPTEVLHQNQDQLTKLIIYDVFTPPVASRIYAYTSLAAYEAIRHLKPDSYPSIAEQLNGFSKFPNPEKDKNYDFTLAATQAFFTVSRKVTFSVDSFVAFENRIYSTFKNNLDEEVYERSIAFGKQVGQIILARSASDNYPQSRGKPKFLGSNTPGKWRPTPPDYFDGVEYCWGEMKTFILDSSSQFAPPPPPQYSEDTNSVFFARTSKCTQSTKILPKSKRKLHNTGMIILL